jgi:hypothetical protein
VRKKVLEIDSTLIQDLEKLCHITENWRGRPLVSREVVVNLISNTTTKTGLNIQAKLDRSSYPIGQKISDDKLERVNLRRDRFQGNWNYSILPNLNLEG